MIGIPFRIVVGKKLSSGMVELVERDGKKTTDVAVAGRGGSSSRFPAPRSSPLVEADASPEAGAVAVLDVRIPPGTAFPYRALPVETLFGEVPASGNGVSLTASPNPIQVTGAVDGITTISWNAPNAASVEIHVGSPNGPLFAAGGNQGSSQTGSWVTDGTIFYLQDVTGGKPLTGSNTLATLVVHLQR